ncbi:hypothetical protein CLOM_g11860 [Closterium sp. NIES-68]|nr:hypothetical protein CLOM_g11860 [Closterium sp. NIES-68]
MRGEEMLMEEELYLRRQMFEHIKDLVKADDSGPRAWKLLRDVIQPNTLPMVIVLEKELAAISMRPGDDVKPVLDKIKDTYARMAAAGSSEGAQGNTYPGMFLMVEDVHGHEGDVGSVGKVVMHPLTHWVIDSGCTSHMTPRADLLDKMPSIPWNGKTPTAATAAAAKATAGGDATAPNDGVLEAIKKVQQQQRHGEVLAGVDASAAWAKASSRSELLLSQAAAIS